MRISRRKEKGYNVWRLAMQVLRGDIILNSSSHHAGMARLKELFGDPRPPGTHLSLTVLDGPSVYWGYTAGYDGASARKVTAILLSTDIDEYAWETPKQNSERQAEARYWKLEKAVCK